MDPRGYDSGPVGRIAPNVTVIIVIKINMDIDITKRGSININHVIDSVDWDLNELISFLCKRIND